MAVTSQKSQQIQDSEASPNRPVEVSDWYGRQRRSFAAFTQVTETGDAGSLALLVTLPPGSVRLFLDESLVYTSGLGTARTMDIGHNGYTAQDGTVVAANTAAFSSGNDVAAEGTFKPVGVNGRTESVFFSLRSPMTIVAQINGGVLNIDSEIDAYFCYAYD